MAEQNPPLWLQNRTDHTAQNERSLIEGIFRREGVLGATALSVTQNGTPNMSVNVSAGRAVIQGDESANQGFYLVWNDAVQNLVISAADPTNPRRDIIVARVKDTYYSGATDAFELAVVQGTPAPSPSDPAIPNNAIQLARVAVAAGATSITNANITDLRPRAAARGGVIVCTSSTRPSAPTAGDLIYETNTKKLLEYQDSTLGWTPPWNLPWGLVGSANLTSNSSSFTTQTDISGLSVTFTSVSGRKYRVSTNVNLQSTVATDDVRGYLFVDGVSTATMVAHLSLADRAYRVQDHTIVSGTGSSMTVKIRGQRQAGSGTCTCSNNSSNSSWLIVEDVGPA
jgi:hypothetical protein